MASSSSLGNSQERRVRGITKGKNTAQIVKRTDSKISVQVDEDFNAFVGVNASKVATVLGIELRKKAPVEGVSKWSEIHPTVKDSIIQGVLDWFHIEGYGKNKTATAVVNAKCQSLYRCWKSRAKNYYNNLLVKGEDPYVHCYPSMEETKWRYLIENVWNTERFKKRSDTNKASRDQVTYNHTMGSKSFASGFYEITTKAKANQEQPRFSEFFKLSHQRSSKKGGAWIDQRCEEDYAALEELENEIIANGEEVISPEELSHKYFGKKNYLKGLGPSMKASSKTRLNGEFNKHHSDELQALGIEVETLRNVRQENEQKIDKLDAVIKSQGEMIEAQNKKIEDLANRHTRFINLLLNGGSISDLILS